MKKVVRRLVGMVALGLLACATATHRADTPPDDNAAPVKQGSRLPMPEGCEPKTGAPLRYPDVEAVFLEHCHRCHTISFGNNEKAQAVFESTTYPFTTNQPDRLLKGLWDQFLTRRGIDDAARCLVAQWLHSGALVADGKPPPYTPLP